MPDYDAAMKCYDTGLSYELAMQCYANLNTVQKIFAGGWVPFGAVCMLAMFVPVLSGVAVWIKKTAGPARLAAAVELYGIDQDKYYQVFIRTRQPSIVSQTCIPIAVVAMVNLYFSTLFIYTPVALRPPGFMVNFLLLGSQYGVKSSPDTDYYMLQTFDAMCYAYLGWYVWTVATIFSRVTTMELVPATYYSLLTRLTVAVFTAVVFRHLQIMLLPSSTKFLAEAVGFGAGLFPDTLFQWMTRQLRRFLLGDTGLTNEYSLDLVQGISPYRKLRLHEIGLDNCMNLAAANPLNLYLASNLSLIEVIDWIAQAQLLMRVGTQKFALLQENGYRTAIDLKRATGSGAVGRLVDLLGFTQPQLEDLQSGMAQDPGFSRIEQLHARID